MLLIKSNKVYDALKYSAQVIIPAVGTLYFALAQTWGLGHANDVVGTLIAVDTFLGVVLHLSSTAYDKTDAKYDGSMDILDTDDKKTYSLNLHKNPDDLDHKDTVVFKVNRPGLKTESKKRRIRK